MGVHAISLGAAALDRLMPMHLRIHEPGVITHAGPTLCKLQPDMPMVGRRFDDVFAMRRPAGISGFADLAKAANLRLHLHLRHAPATTFKGVLVPSNDPGEVIINLSFGISIVEAIHDFNLHSSDFPATDLAVEMLYLIEAKTAILGEWRKLNARLKTAKVAAEEQAFTDTLTGLKNRRAMDHVMTRYLAAGQPFGLVNLDLDYFKSVNDTLGHAAGDLVLQEAARIMVRSTRSRDTLVRSGGDEFLLILPELVDPENLTEFARRLIAQLEVPIPFEDQSCKISGSIGIAVFEPGTEMSSDRLLAQADQALYASKRAGRGRATLYSSDLPALAEDVPAA